MTEACKVLWATKRVLPCACSTAGTKAVPGWPGSHDPARSSTCWCRSTASAACAAAQQCAADSSPCSSKIALTLPLLLPLSWPSLIMQSSVYTRNLLFCSASSALCLAPRRMTRGTPSLLQPWMNTFFCASSLSTWSCSRWGHSGFRGWMIVRCGCGCCRWGWRPGRERKQRVSHVLELRLLFCGVVGSDLTACCGCLRCAG